MSHRSGGQRSGRILAAAVWLLGATLVEAQSTAPGSGWGGGGGGSRGSGSSAGTNRTDSRSETSYRHESKGGRFSPLSLLADAAIRAELGLDELQQGRVAAIQAEVTAAESGLERQLFGGQEERTASLVADARRREELMHSLRQESDRTGSAIEGFLLPPQREQVRRWCAEDRAASAGARKSAAAAGMTGGTARAEVGVEGVSPNNRMKVSSNVVHSAGGYASGGEPGSVVRAVRRPDAARKLQLTPDQSARLQEELERFAGVEAKYFDDQQAVGSATRAARQANWGRQGELFETARVAAARGNRAVEALLAPGQKRRLDELRLQAAGTAGLLQADVVRQLGLSPTQQARLAALRQELRSRDEARFRTGQGRPAATGAASGPQAQREEEERRVAGLLTPAQQAGWRALQGRPFPGIEHFRAGDGGGGGGTSGSGDATVVR